MASLMRQLGELVAARQAHAARTVVLLPFFHLLPLARQAWAQQAATGFSPRFETTQTWSAPGAFEPASEDFAGDIGRDLLTARGLLERAGLGARGDELAGQLVQAASQLASVAAAVAPEQRGAWAGQMRKAATGGMEGELLALESAVAAIAIEWIAASGFASDDLLAGDRALDVDLLVLIEGGRANPVSEAVAARLQDKVVRLRLDLPAPLGNIALHEAANPADEAERAAACVLQHVEQGHTPVALAAIDRVLTRRIRAMLEQRGVALRDETGWKLSTTRAGAHVMLALRGCAWNASSDAVIDWLKNAPAISNSSVLALERRVRRAGIRDWRALGNSDFSESQQDLRERIASWREAMQPMRPLAQWLSALREMLGQTGQWDRLASDAAGARVIDALRLATSDHAEIESWPQAARRISLSDFTQWVNESLEAESFVPPQPAQEQVVILPLHQLFARPFPALVLAGCDEIRLPAAPEPGGLWTATQRRVVGLPSREDLESEMRAAWRHAMQTPLCDVLWRASDDSGEAVLPSALVQSLQVPGTAHDGVDLRQDRIVEVRPTDRPQPVGSGLPIDKLSASAYDNLRRCPYQFFALRQLGLQEPEEIDQELDKRDFGNWLHKVLKSFHESLAENWEPAGLARVGMLDRAADEVSREERLEQGEFLPFSAAWPQTRDGYLQWLAEHEAKEGAAFHQAESDHEMQLGPVKLFGRIDRIDRLRDGSTMVMDYKTEGAGKTSERIGAPGEDTQLAFYAALLHDDTLRAAYVNVGERGVTKTMEQREVVAARDLLVHGILDEFARIADGEPLPAMGEGQACDFCSARGLCRKDFWT